MKSSVLAAAAVLAAMLTGCSQYHADIPEFTTASPSRLSANPGNGDKSQSAPARDSDEWSDVEEKLDLGGSEVEKKSGEVSSEVDRMIGFIKN